MANQESGRIKQFKLRIPMELYQQLVKDAEYHREAPSTRARHILSDSLIDVELTADDRAAIDRMVAENWARIRGEA